MTDVVNPAEAGNETNINDIVRQQSTTIDTLVAQMGKPSGQAQQPIYMTTPERTKAAPNYILYIVVGLGLYLLLR